MILGERHRVEEEVNVAMAQKKRSSSWACGCYGQRFVGDTVVKNEEGKPLCSDYNFVEVFACLVDWVQQRRGCSLRWDSHLVDDIRENLWEYGVGFCQDPNELQKMVYTGDYSQDNRTFMSRWYTTLIHG